MLKDVLTLSVLQGVAEFLPISSSGHLQLGKLLLNLPDIGIRLDIFLHLGTLLAVFVFYWAIIRRLVCGCLGLSGEEEARAAWLYALKIFLSAIPVGLVGIWFKDSIGSSFSNSRLVGGALIFTGLVLLLTSLLPKGKGSVSFFSALGMGFAQAIAILPGVSRSGMTLAAARTMKVEPSASAEFSFLMSAPPILGAALLEILKALRGSEAGLEGAAAASEVSWVLCGVGALVAAMVGYFALKLLVSSLKGRYFWLFGPYCLLAGLLTLFLV